MIVKLTKRFIPRLPQKVEDDTDTSEYEGFYCIEVPLVICTCGHFQKYFEPVRFHVVLVWENGDDETIKAVVEIGKDLGVDAEIVEYKSVMGTAIDFYKAHRQGLLHL